MDFKINLKRLETDLYELAKIGFNDQDKGIYRQGFTEADMQARDWLEGKFREAGLITYRDGANNVLGRLGDLAKPAILIGSHLDSVPCGGIFDGTLGVLAGLEVLRVIKENSIAVNCPIEVIATSEEEGRFGGMFGAQAITGNLTLDWMEKASDPNGELLKDAMAKFGLDYHEALNARRRSDEMLAFLELHIEQGPVLDSSKKQIGIVEGISGVFKWVVRLIGKADHAGTAPMDMRSDAFMGLADFAHEIERIIAEEGTEKSRLTIGYVELKPGYAHTIPGEAKFTLVGRDMSTEVMQKLSEASRKVLSAIARKHGLKFEYDQLSWLEPRFCSKSLINQIERDAKALNLDYIHMPSGAGHDAQFFSEVTKSAMIFVPSVGGVSHAPDEWTHWQDVENGCNLLLRTTLKLSTTDNSTK